MKSLSHAIGAHVLHSRYDSRELTKNARTEFLARFDREVDPDFQLSPEERTRRADHARKAYFARLAIASAKARRRKNSATREATLGKATTGAA